MKIKVSDLYDLSLGLADLAEKELPISTSLAVQRNQKKISEELISSDKVRQTIIEEHTEKKLDEGVVKLDKEGQKKMHELMIQDIELDLQKINIKSLQDITIKPKTLALLNKILEENIE